MDKLSAGLTGIAGEYFVAAELSRRGWMASITLRNNDSIDIHASSLVNERLLSIQVKTTQVKARRWPLNVKAEQRYSDNHFYVFVHLKELVQRPDYFIVPSEVVARTVRETHQLWLDTLGRKGQAHNDSAMRVFTDMDGIFLERWDLLDL
ncbi:hypothetical protein [Fibrella aestuarina]|uniref:hypothetical protein n=1 Tax=Fibrella aestuarina TaxID=651143 RepID=UPI00059D0369|nr:hypothetical protein [Fibrella aestuarina]